MENKKVKKEKPFISMVRDDKGAFIPAMEIDQEKFRKWYAVGDVVKIPKPRKNRNYKFLQKYQTLISLVFENLPENFELELSNGYRIPINDRDDLHKQVKMKAGIYNKFKTWGGKEVIEVGSIDFDSMDNIEFQEFYDKVFDIIQTFFIPYIEKEFLEAEVAGFF